MIISGNTITVNGTSVDAANVVGGAAKGFYLNPTSIDQSFAIPSGQNAMTAGPVTLDTAAIVTIPDGSVWTIV